MTKAMFYLVTPWIALLLVACSVNPKTSTLPPGALSQVDAQSYEALMGAQAVLNSIKADADKLPPTAKPSLNKAILSYDAAEAAWQAFHAGKGNDPAALSAAITQATVDIAALVTQIGAAK